MIQRKPLNMIRCYFPSFLSILLQYVVVEILLEHGADIEAKTRNGETALGTYYSHARPPLCLCTSSF